MNVYIKEIVLPALNETYNKKGIRRWIFGTSLSALLGALAIFKTVFDKEDWGWQKSASVFLVFFAGLYIIIFIWHMFKYAYKYFLRIYREAIYGDAIILLKDAFSKVHSLKRVKDRGKSISDKELKSTLTYFCNNLKKIYEKKTKSVCSICIKVVVGNNTNFSANSEIMTFCRDKDSHSKRSENKDYKERAKNVKHSIFNNSCFNDIFAAFLNKKIDKLYYFNNSLPETIGYRNSSDVIYLQNLTDNTSIKDRKRNWKMPYRSEIVVPIMPRVNEIANEYEIIGFLCVDCDTEKVFDDKYDIAIIQGVADGIYDIIKMRT